MLFLGNLLYVTCLLLNAVSILSEDRFLARVGLSPTTYDPAFGAGADSQSARAKVVHLIASIRTLMRCMLWLMGSRMESQSMNWLTDMGEQFL